MNFNLNDQQQKAVEIVSGTLFILQQVTII